MIINIIFNLLILILIVGTKVPLSKSFPKTVDCLKELRNDLSHSLNTHSVMLADMKNKYIIKLHLPPNGCINELEQKDMSVKFEGMVALIK